MSCPSAAPLSSKAFCPTPPRVYPHLPAACPASPGRPPSPAPPSDPALLDRMRQLRMEAFRQMSGTLLLQRIPAYMMYTLNLETGQLHTQAPAHHWEAVAANIAPR